MASGASSVLKVICLTVLLQDRLVHHLLERFILRQLILRTDQSSASDLRNS
jgi:hypothetical protein